MVRIWRYGTGALLAVLVAGGLVASQTAATAAVGHRPDYLKGWLYPTGLACPTKSKCLLIGIADDGGGKSAVITASSGEVKQWRGELKQGVFGLACPSAKKCLSASINAIASVAVGTGKMGFTARAKVPKNKIPSLGDIACAPERGCAAAGYEGLSNSSKRIGLAARLTTAGKIVKLATDKTYYDVNSLACPTSSRCLMMTEDHEGGWWSVLLNHGAFGSAKTLPSPPNAEAGEVVSCYGSDVCLGVSAIYQAEKIDTRLFFLNPDTGAREETETVSNFAGLGVTCVSASKCLVAGQHGSAGSPNAAVVTVTGRAPGKPVDYSGTVFNYVACATKDLCYAAGNGGPSYEALVEKL